MDNGLGNLKKHVRRTKKKKKSSEQSATLHQANQTKHGSQQQKRSGAEKEVEDVQYFGEEDVDDAHSVGGFNPTQSNLYTRKKSKYSQQSSKSNKSRNSDKSHQSSSSLKSTLTRLRGLSRDILGKFNVVKHLKDYLGAPSTAPFLKSRKTIQEMDLDSEEGSHHSQQTWFSGVSPKRKKSNMATNLSSLSLRTINFANLGAGLGRKSMNSRKNKNKVAVLDKETIGLMRKREQERALKRQQRASRDHGEQSVASPNSMNKVGSLMGNPRASSGESCCTKPSQNSRFSVSHSKQRMMIRQDSLQSVLSSGSRQSRPSSSKSREESKRKMKRYETVPSPMRSSLMSLVPSRGLGGSKKGKNILEPESSHELNVLDIMELAVDSSSMAHNANHAKESRVSRHSRQSLMDGRRKSMRSNRSLSEDFGGHQTSNQLLGNSKIAVSPPPSLLVARSSLLVENRARSRHSEDRMFDELTKRNEALIHSNKFVSFTEEQLVGSQFHEGLNMVVPKIEEMRSSKLTNNRKTREAPNQAAMTSLLEIAGPAHELKSAIKREQRVTNVSSVKDETDDEGDLHDRTKSLKTDGDYGFDVYQYYDEEEQGEQEDEKESESESEGEKDDTDSYEEPHQAQAGNDDNDDDSEIFIDFDDYEEEYDSAEEDYEDDQEVFGSDGGWGNKVLM